MRTLLSDDHQTHRNCNPDTDVDINWPDPADFLPGNQSRSQSRGLGSMLFDHYCSCCRRRSQCFQSRSNTKRGTSGSIFDKDYSQTRLLQQSQGEPKEVSIPSLLYETNLGEGRRRSMNEIRNYDNNGQSPSTKGEKTSTTTTTKFARVRRKGGEWSYYGNPFGQRKVMTPTKEEEQPLPSTATNMISTATRTQSATNSNEAETSVVKDRQQQGVANSSVEFSLTRVGNQNSDKQTCQERGA